MSDAVSACACMGNAAQYQAVLQHGRVVARTAHFALHAISVCDAHHHAAQVQALAESARKPLLFPLKNSLPLYVGTIVPKRWARRAVTRNLIKRQIRNLVLEYAREMPKSLAVVVRLHASFDKQFISASSPALRSTVRGELGNLFGKPDWQAFSVHKYATDQSVQNHKILQQPCPIEAIALPSGTMPNLP